MCRDHAYRMLMVFLILTIAGCDKDVSVSVPKDSATSVYFPGGLGIDFGVQPTKIESVSDGDAVARIVVYNLPHKFSAIDEQVAEILTEEGYQRSERLLPKTGANVVYQKGGDSLLFKYRIKVLEGLEYNVELTVSWLE